MHKRSSQQVGRLGSVGGHGVDVAEAARACAAPGIGQNSTRAGAAEFWAMSGAATKLPPKKLLQRHAGPSQRAAGQLLLWARTVLGPISRFSHPISLVSPYRESGVFAAPQTRQLCSINAAKLCRYPQRTVQTCTRENESWRQPSASFVVGTTQASATAHHRTKTAARHRVE